MTQALTRPALWLMTFATGVAVANLYYCQPLLHLMQLSLGGDERALGWIPTLTQVGYALGMLLLVPLGDLYERRRLITLFTALAAAALAGMAVSRSLAGAATMSLLLGLTTMTPQLIIPFVAHLAPPEKRGQSVGTVMGGLLLGILLARTVAGFVGAQFGWRVMFGAGAAAMLILAAVLAFALPKSQPTFQGTYGGLLRSILSIVEEQPVLREAMGIGAMLFAAFSAFWATLIHLMAANFHLGARAVGLFGLLGAAGAGAAPLVGMLADRRNPRFSIGVGIVLTALSFVIYGVWGAHSLLALAIGVALMDIGVQGSGISNQGRIFALLPEARSRVNTAYMFSYFVGGALGSYLASVAWSIAGWPGVCGCAGIFLFICLVVFLKPNFALEAPGKAL